MLAESVVQVIETLDHGVRSSVLRAAPASSVLLIVVVEALRRLLVVPWVVLHRATILLRRIKTAETLKQKVVLAVAQLLVLAVVLLIKWSKVLWGMPISWLIEFGGCLTVSFWIGFYTTGIILYLLLKYCFCSIVYLSIEWMIALFLWLFCCTFSNKLK